jgi:hypothetical protein
MVINLQDLDLITGGGLMSTSSVSFVGDIGAHFLPYDSD